MIPEATWRPSNFQYHGTTDRWSASMLKVFHESPGLAFRRFVARSSEALSEPTESLVIGSAVNSLILDPAGGGIYVAPVQTRGAQAYRDAVRSWAHERLVLTQRENALAQSVAGAILEPRTRAAEVARALLSGELGVNEWAHRWDDNGVPCKTMVDRLTVVGDRLAYLELKSTRDPAPREFQRQAWTLGYHRQLAFNLRGVRDACQAAGLDAPVELYFVAVRNDEPFDVAVYRAGAGFLAAGEAEVERDLRDLAACLGDASGRSWCREWERLDDDQIPTLDAPHWARTTNCPGAVSGGINSGEDPGQGENDDESETN